MPLPPSTGRVELHHRQIEMRGYRRTDGNYEIDARVTDRKTHPITPPGGGVRLSAGEPIHDMWLRVVVNDDLDVLELVTATDASPYPICSEGGAALQRMVGARIGPGWTRRVKDTLGGVASCTHLMELLIPLATAAYQSISHVRMSRPDVLDASGRPQKIDSCYAYGSARSVVAVRWPAFYTGPSSNVARDDG